MEFQFTLDKRGYIKKRESFDLEFKQNFQLGDNLLKYIKSLVGMANNKGGQIIFGIQDKPHLPNGMTNLKFRDTDPVSIDRQIREYFSQELIWESHILEYDNKEFGVLVVKEAENKPIICKKNKDNILREAAIYYRYRAETREIEFPELKNILDKEKEKEKNLWMNCIQKISSIGLQNVSLFDTYRGEISIGNGKILLDKSILDKVKFIKEGKFTESQEEGLPTLRIVGDIEGLVESDAFVATDTLYPLFTNDLKDRLSLNGYEVKCVIWKLKVKGNRKYHAENQSGKNSNPIHKFSEKLIPLIQRLLQTDLFLAKCLTDFKDAHPFKPKEKEITKFRAKQRSRNK